jgi:hypothetical protein
VLADQRQRQEEQRQPRSDRPAEYGDEYAEDDFYGDSHSPYAPGSSANGNTAPNGAQNGGNGASSTGVGNGGDRDNRAERDSRPEREPRQDREPRAEREPRQDREGRPERGRRPERAERAPQVEAPIAGAAAAEPQLAADGEPSVYEPVENPFLRESRTPRTRKPRRERDEDAGQPGAEAEPELGLNDAPAFDPSSLPPAISTRKATAKPVAAPVAVSDDTAAEAPAKPKRRTRRAASAAEDGATPETVN